MVVADLEAALRDYARLWGVEEWHVADLGPDRLSDMVSHGRRSEGEFVAALGATTPPAGGDGRPVGLELVQPRRGESPFQEFLWSREEGIAHLTVRAEGTPEEVAAHFAEQGVGVAASWRQDGRERVFWDTRADLGGHLLEVITGPAEPRGEVRRIDGAALREGRDALPIGGIQHFGVVVDDVMATTERYHQLLGIETFDVKTWQDEPGRLDAPCYRDQRPVHHGYFTAQGAAGDVGFEIIAMKYGDAHYNREFTDDRGPGIHHLFPFLTTDEPEWERVVADMTALGAPLCMGSELRGGAATYGYFDTWDALRGFLVEGVVRRRPAEPRYMEPDWRIDYSTTVA